jgi:hypothetical protein
MTKDELFPSKFLKASDLAGQQLTMRINRMVREEVGPEKVLKPVVYFDHEEKGLVLNQTNFDSIEEITGERDSDNWTGFEIMLVPRRAQYQGKLVDAIRIEKPAPKKRSKNKFEEAVDNEAA